jgi:hypothetical protein
MLLDGATAAAVVDRQPGAAAPAPSPPPCSPNDSQFALA